MATKRGLLDFGAHGRQAMTLKGTPDRYGRETKGKVRRYFTGKHIPSNRAGTPDMYNRENLELGFRSLTPEESREATNYFKAMDKAHSWADWNKNLGGGSSFLQGAASDSSDNYKDSETLEEEEIERLSDLNWADSQELSGDLHDIGNRGESIDEIPRALDSEDIADWKEDSLSELRHKIDKRNSLLASSESDLDYDPDEEAFDHSPRSDKDGGFAASFSSGSDGKLTPMQKYGAQLITDIFSEKEEAPMQVASVVPLTPGRSLDMSKYLTTRPKRERYRNLGLLGRA